MRVVAEHANVSTSLLEGALRLSLQQYANKYEWELISPFIGFDINDMPDIRIVSEIFGDQDHELTYFDDDREYPRMDVFGIYRGEQNTVEIDINRIRFEVERVAGQPIEEIDLGFLVYVVAVHQLSHQILDFRNVNEQILLDPIFHKMTEDTLCSVLALSIIFDNARELGLILGNIPADQIINTAIDLYNRMPERFAAATQFFDEFTAPINLKKQSMPIFQILESWMRRKKSLIAIEGPTESAILGEIQSAEQIRKISLGQFYLLARDWKYCTIDA